MNIKEQIPKGGHHRHSLLDAFRRTWRKKGSFQLKCFAIMSETCLMCVHIVIFSYNGCIFVFQATSTARSLRSIIDPIGDFRQLRNFFRIRDGEDFLNLVVSDSSWQSVTTSRGRLTDVSADERTKQWRETDVCSKRARHPFFQLQNSKPLKGSGYSSFWLEAKQPPKFENFDPKVCPLGPQGEPQWDLKAAT